MTATISALFALAMTMGATWALDSEGLTVRVQQSWHEAAGCFVSGDTLPFALVVENPTSRTRTVALQMYDQHGYPLSLPRGLAVRVFDVGGRNAAPESRTPSLKWTDADGWMVQGKYSSQICEAEQRVSAECSQPGDIVTLQAGESVRRVFNLSGFPGWNLPSGEYTIEVRLFGTTSTKYPFKVTEPGGCE